MKANKYFDMTDTELNQQLADLKSELFNLRFQLAINQLENPMRISAVKKDIARVLLSEEQLQSRIREMAAQISEDYRGKNPTMVCILGLLTLLRRPIEREGGLQ